MSKKYLIVVTGGTIDAEPYQETPKNVTPLKESIVPRILEELGVAHLCDVLIWHMKDSKDFTDGELHELAKIIRDQAYTSVVITHGTDYMAHNARVMASKRYLFGEDVTAVFTGAMTPYMNQVVGYGQSDAPENVRFAIHEAYYGSPGVHIAMAGEVHDPFHTVKDMERKRFVHVDEVQEPHLQPAIPARRM
ncbi:MAG: asparaginase [Alphaproteobacteria bacterium]|nr:asparaginase [Alphaproteobacteria bacterium]